MDIIFQDAKLQIKQSVWELGQNCYRDGRVHINEIEQGYMLQYSEAVYCVKATVEENKRKLIPVTIWINEGKMIQVECKCEECHPYSYFDYYMMSPTNSCYHVAAVVAAVEEYQKTHPLKYATNYRVSNLIHSYVDAQVADTIVKHQEEKIEIEPKLEYDGTYRLGFRIGAAKKYVIKNLYEFARRCQENEEYSYGKDLTVLHSKNSFSQESQQLVEFIMDCVKENELVLEHLSDNYIQYSFNKRYLTLTPAIIDKFYPLMRDKKLLFMDNTQKIVESKRAELFDCKEGFFPISLNVEPYYENDLKEDYRKKSKNGYQQNQKKINPPRVDEKSQNNKPLGIRVKVNIPYYLVGQKSIYQFKNRQIVQTDSEYRNYVLPFLKNINQMGESEFVVGEEDVGAFYNTVLTKLEKYIEIKEVNREGYEAMLPKEASYYFYLDREENGKITCLIAVRYGEDEFNIMQKSKTERCVRNIPEELSRILIVQRFLEEYDEITGMYYTEQEEKIYQFLQNGLDELRAIGEIRATDQFRRLRIHVSPKVKVGVSVESELMNLEITSEEFDFSELKEILSSYRLRKKYHRLNNGEFLQLEDNSLETVIELMEGMHLSVKDLVKGKMHLPAYRAIYLDRVLAESEDVDYLRDRRFKAMLRNWKSFEDSDYELPEDLKSILRGYQKTGYRWLRTIDDYGFGGILADDMGLGKTLQIIALIQGKKEDEEGKSQPSLIVCPASLVYNWEKEFQIFSPSLSTAVVAGSIEERDKILNDYKKYDALITSYDLLKRDIQLYEDKTFCYEVIDEAQYIKNHNTQGAKAVKLIQSKTRFALTGTPIENRLSELWSIFDYLMPGYLYKYEQFKKELETPITKYQEEHLMERLKKLVQPFILRRLKANVLKELPEKLEQITFSKMSGEQQKLYDAYVSQMKAQLASQSPEEFERNKLKILADLTRLRQICCDPSLCYENYSSGSAKLETCLDLVRNAIEGGHKILLFSQFTSMLAIIGEKLQEDGITYYSITGETSKQKRIQLVNQFNEDETQVFLISLKAGGTGLNLTGADIVIHYDPWWNVAAENQATDRAHRIGQKKVVSVFKLITQGTIEEKIQKLQVAKKDLADQIISGEMNQLSKMGKEDFLNLL